MKKLFFIVFMSCSLLIGACGSEGIDENDTVTEETQKINSTMEETLQNINVYVGDFVEHDFDISAESTKVAVDELSYILSDMNESVEKFGSDAHLIASALDGYIRYIYGDIGGIFIAFDAAYNFDLIYHGNEASGEFLSFIQLAKQHVEKGFNAQQSEPQSEATQPEPEISESQPEVQEPETEFPEGTTADGYDINSPYANAGNTPELAMGFIKEYSTIIQQLHEDEGLLFNESYRNEIWDFYDRVSAHGDKFDLHLLAASSEALGQYVETGDPSYVSFIVDNFDAFNDVMPKSEYTDYIRLYAIEIEMREDNKANNGLNDMEIVDPEADTDFDFDFIEDTNVAATAVLDFNELMGQLVDDSDIINNDDFKSDVYNFGCNISGYGIVEDSRGDRYDLDALSNSAHSFVQYIETREPGALDSAITYAENTSLDNEMDGFMAFNIHALESFK